MKVSLAWLREFVPIELDVEELAARIDARGIKVEGIERPWAGLDGVVVATVREVRDHPNSEKLCLATVDAGDGPVQVVVGIRNMAPGDLVPWAKPGSRVPLLDEPLGARSLRGEMSNGMLCSPRELAISQEHETGILILPPDLTPGADLKSALGLDDALIDIEVEPNRPDFLSVYGVARETSSILGLPLADPDTDLEEEEERADAVATVELRAPDGLPLLPGADPPRSVPGCDADPRAGQAHGSRDAAGGADRRRHQLRDVGARATAARVRPRPARRARDRGPPGRGRGAAHDPRRRGSGAARRGPRDLRRREAGRARRRDGGAVLGGLGLDDRRPPRVGVLHQDRGHPDGPSTRPAFRGVAPLRARDRSRRGGAGRPPVRGADRPVDRSPRAGGRRAGGRPAPAAPGLDARFPGDGAPRLSRRPVGCRCRVRRAADGPPRGGRRRRGGDPGLPARHRARGRPDRGGGADPGLRGRRCHRAPIAGTGWSARRVRVRAPGPRRARARRTPRGEAVAVRVRGRSRPDG